MSTEQREINPDILTEEMSDVLFWIREQLAGLVFTPEVLTSKITDVIEEKLERAKQTAVQMGDKVKEEILATLGIHFYSLHTIGIVDDRRKFESEAAHAFDLVDMALLCMDGMVAKNKGKIMATLAEERQRNS